MPTLSLFYDKRTSSKKSCKVITKSLNQTMDRRLVKMVKDKEIHVNSYKMNRNGKKLSLQNTIVNLKV